MQINNGMKKIYNQSRQMQSYDTSISPLVWLIWGREKLMVKNKAFVGLGSCDNLQTKRSIFEYANWPRLQIKRTGPSSWSVQLVCLASLSSGSVQLVRPAGLTSRPIYTLHLTHCILHVAFDMLHLTHCILHVVSYTLHLKHCIFNIPCYTMHLAHCFLHIASYTLHFTHYIFNI